MSQTQAYRDDVFDLPVDDPSQWLRAVQRGNASIRGNAYKVAHLLLFGTEPSPAGYTCEEVTCPTRLTHERCAGLTQVSQVRPEIGYALLKELRGHPDQAEGLAAVLPTLQSHPAGWHRIAAALLTGPRDGQFEAWLNRCDWPLASSQEGHDLMAECASHQRADVLAHLRPRWENDPGAVDRLMDLAVPSPDPLCRLAVLREVVTAHPSEIAVTQAWIRLAKSDQPDHPHWAQVAQLLPAIALAPVVTQLVWDRGGCWLSHEGNPLDIAVLADRLGCYATPDTQAILRASFPGQLPAMTAQQRRRALAERPPAAPGRRQRA